MTASADQATAAETVRALWLDEAVMGDSAAKVAKINARATKHGLTGALTFRPTGEIRREPVYLTEGQPAPGQEPDYYVTSHKVEILGQPPKLAGWSFLAVLTWDAGTLVTRTSPGFSGTIEANALVPMGCDHCHTERDRNDTYLVENGDGTRKQVGSSCIKDFLGHDFSPSWVNLGAELDDLEERYGSQRESEVASVDRVLGYAVTMTADGGWISREKAEIEQRTPSSFILRDLLFSNARGAQQARQRLAPTKADLAEAAEVKAWALAADDSANEYLANVKRLAAAEYVSARNVGYIGSAVAARRREIARAAERAAAPVSNFIGTPKERMDFGTLTVKGETFIDGDYGVTHLYTLADPAGNLVKWFSSRDQDWTSGQEVHLMATVKGHEVYRDVKQTVITRAKELPVITTTEKEAG